MKSDCLKGNGLEIPQMPKWWLREKLAKSSLMHPWLVSSGSVSNPVPWLVSRVAVGLTESSITAVLSFGLQGCADGLAGFNFSVQLKSKGTAWFMPCLLCFLFSADICAGRFHVVCLLHAPELRPGLSIPPRKSAQIYRGPLPS